MTERPLEPNQRAVDDVLVVDVPSAGDGVRGADLLRRKLRTIFEQGQKFVLLNVAELTYVDSVWLGALLQGYASAIRHGGALKLVHVSARLKELLRVTKLDRVIERFDSETEAAASFRPGQRSDPERSTRRPDPERE